LKPFSEVVESAKKGKKPIKGLLIVDVSLPEQGIDQDVLAAYDKVTIDHHGRHDSQDERSSTIKLLERLANIDIVYFSTTNLGDGGSWPYWIVQNKQRVIRDVELQKLIRQAAYFEDFKVFSGRLDLDQLDLIDRLADSRPGVLVQLALFFHYDQELKKAGLKTDRIGDGRFAEAKRIYQTISQKISAFVSDPTGVAVRKDASKFVATIKEARDKLKKEGILYGFRDRLLVFDSKIIDDFGVFAGWAAPNYVADHYLHIMCRPLSDGRYRMLIAIPHGRKIPSGKNLMDAISRIKLAEEKKAQKLNQTPAKWFGRASVLIAGGPKGTLLTPKEVANILKPCFHDP
jgi:hypothetical protein